MKTRVVSAVAGLVILGALRIGSAAEPLIIQEPHELASFTAPTGLQWMAATADGNVVVAGGAQVFRPGEKEKPLPSIRFWDLEAGKQKNSLKGVLTSIHALVMTRDGKKLAVAASENDITRQNPAITLYDVATGKGRVLHKGSIEGSGHGLAFSPDGKLLAATLQNHNIKVWNVADGGEYTTFTGHAQPIWALTFSPDSTLLASTCGVLAANKIQTAAGEIRLWDLAGKKEKTSFRGHANRIHALAFTPDGKFLVTGGGGHFVGFEPDRSIKFWNLATLKEVGTLQGHNSAIHAFAFTADGRFLATGSSDNTVRIWDVPQGLEVALLRTHGDTVESVAFTANETRLLTAARSSIKVWHFKPSRSGVGLEPPPGQTLAFDSVDRVLLKGHQDGIIGLGFTPDGGTLVTGGWDKTVKQWAIPAGTEKSSFVAHNQNMTAFALAADGQTLATAGADKSLKLWELPSGKERAVLAGHGNHVLTLAFSRDGKVLASADSGPALARGAKATVKLWDVPNAKEVASSQQTVPRLALSPDGKVLVAGVDVRDRLRSNQVFVYTIPHLRWSNAATNEELALVKAHDKPLRSLAFSGDGKLLATGSADRTVIVWDAETRKPLTTLRGHLSEVQSVAFSTDGQLLASGDENGIVKFWDPGTGKDLATIKAHDVTISCLAFAPDGRLLAVAGRSPIVRLVEVPVRR